MNCGGRIHSGTAQQPSGLVGLRNHHAREVPPQRSPSFRHLMLHLPKTGYPPTDVESWRRIITSARTMG
jgi:hypothetical protein